MDERERHAEGMKVRRDVLGDDHVDRAVARTIPLTAEFQDLITRYAWGEIWTRPGLDLRARRLLVIGTLLALGRFDELRMHVRAAIEEEGCPWTRSKKCSCSRRSTAASRPPTRRSRFCGKSSKRRPGDSVAG